MKKQTEYITVKCKKCGKAVVKDKRRYEFKKEWGQTDFYCKSCSLEYIKEKRGNWIVKKG